MDTGCILDACLIVGFIVIDITQREDKLKLAKFIFYVGTLILFSLNLGCSKITQLAESVSVEELNIATTSLKPGVNSKFYSDILTASGGKFPYSFKIKSGQLPSGLSFSSTGEIKGTPASIFTGKIVFEVADSKGETATKELNMIISNELSITTTSLPNATVGLPYSTAISVVGGTGVYTFSATGLNSGFTINSMNGIISGRSASESSNNVVITVVDDSGLQDSAEFLFSVSSPPDITTTSLPIAAISANYSTTLASTGGSAPFTWAIAVGTLPAGLSLSSSGVISGNNLPSSSFPNSPISFTVRVTDSLGQTDTQALSLTIASIPRVLDDIRDPLTVGRTGQSYSYFLRSEGGGGAITYSATGLPAGLSLNSVSGRISGTCAIGSEGTYSVTFTATSSQGFSSSTIKKIRVVAATKSDINFSNAIQTPIGLYGASWAYPSQMGFDVGLMNSDTNRDVVWGAQNSRGIISLIGDGTGVFTKTFFTSPGGARPRMVKLFDLNGDGVLDVVSSTMDSRLEVYLGNASKWPNTPTSASFAVGYDNYGFDVSDLNGDGKPDIVLTNWTSGDIRVLFNCGLSATVNIPAAATCNLTAAGINLHTVTIASLSQPRDLVIHDFDGDGKKDIIATSYAGSVLGIILGNGNGTFNPIYTVSTDAAGPRGIVKADMNQDGRMDVVVTGDNAISVFLNISGTAPRSVEFQTTAYAINDLGVNSEDIDAGDLNGDGFPDVAFVSGGTAINSLGIFINDGTGSLSSRQMIHSGYQTFGVKLAPVMAASVTAGRPDILTGVGHWIGLSNLVIYPNTLTASTPIKYGNKYFNTSPQSFATIYGEAKAADFNKDGFPDVIYKLGGAANLMLGLGDGTFALTSENIPTGDIASATWHGKQSSVADLNGDGNMDYISANWNNGGLASVTSVLGNGNGTFGTQSTFTIDVAGCSANMGARAVDTGDFNRDGKIDLLVGAGCNTPSNIPRAYIFFGNGDGTFNTSTRKELVGSSAYVFLVAARDVNSDGIVDAVIVSNDSVIKQYTSDGNGNFTLFGQADMSISSNLSSLLIGDLDKNGYLDYIVTSSSTSVAARSMSTSTGSISGGITTTISGLTGDYNGQPQAGAALIDFDEDGILDFITMRRFQDMNPSNRNGGGGFHLYKGTGSGTFNVQNRVLAPAAYGPYSEGFLTIFDADRDGVLDIINTNFQPTTDSGIGVNLNSSK